MVSSASLSSSCGIAPGVVILPLTYIFASAVILLCPGVLGLPLLRYQRLHALEEEQEQTTDPGGDGAGRRRCARSGTSSSRTSSSTWNTISTLVLDNQPHIAARMIARLAICCADVGVLDTRRCLKEESRSRRSTWLLEQVHFGARLMVAFAIDPATRGAIVHVFCCSPWWRRDSAWDHETPRRNLVLRSDTVSAPACADRKR